MEVWGGSSRFRGHLSMPGNDVSVVSEPCEGGAEGGDVYYLSNCAAGLITRVILADISGHGAGMAGVARELRDLMRRHINTADQTRLAAGLNHAFAGAGGGTFATALLLTYFAPTDHLIVCNAGHPRPLLYRAASREWSALDGKAPGVLAAGAGAVGIANLPLGILDPIGYEQVAVRLERGDLVVLFSDALIEAAAGGKQIGEAGLLEIARGLTDAERTDAAAAIHAAVMRVSEGPLGDDATVVALHHNAADPPPAGWRSRAGVLAGMLGLGVTHSAPV